MFFVFARTIIDGNCDIYKTKLEYYYIHDKDVSLQHTNSSGVTKIVADWQENSGRNLVTFQSTNIEKKNKYEDVISV